MNIYDKYLDRKFKRMSDFGLVYEHFIPDKDYFVLDKDIPYKNNPNNIQKTLFYVALPEYKDGKLYWSPLYCDFDEDDKICFYKGPYFCAFFHDSGKTIELEQFNYGQTYKTIKAKDKFEQAKVLFDILESQKDKDLDPKTKFLLRIMYNQSKGLVFNDYVKGLECLFNRKTETNEVFQDLKALKNDVNNMPLGKFILKYEAKNKENKQKREDFRKQQDEETKRYYEQKELNRQKNLEKTVKNMENEMKL